MKGYFERNYNDNQEFNKADFIRVQDIIRFVLNLSETDHEDPNDIRKEIRKLIIDFLLTNGYDVEKISKAYSPIDPQWSINSDFTYSLYEGYRNTMRNVKKSVNIKNYDYGNLVELVDNKYITKEEAVSKLLDEYTKEKDNNKRKKIQIAIFNMILKENVTENNINGILQNEKTMYTIQNYFEQKFFNIDFKGSVGLLTSFYPEDILKGVDYLYALIDMKVFPENAENAETAEPATENTIQLANNEPVTELQNNNVQATVKKGIFKNLKASKLKNIINIIKLAYGKVSQQVATDESLGKGTSFSRKRIALRKVVYIFVVIFRLIFKILELLLFRLVQLIVQAVKNLVILIINKTRENQISYEKFSIINYFYSFKNLFKFYEDLSFKEQFVLRLRAKERLRILMENLPKEPEQKIKPLIKKREIILENIPPQLPQIRPINQEEPVPPQDKDTVSIISEPQHQGPALDSLLLQHDQQEILKSVINPQPIIIQQPIQQQPLYKQTFGMQVKTPFVQQIITTEPKEYWFNDLDGRMYPVEKLSEEEQEYWKRKLKEEEKKRDEYYINLVEKYDKEQEKNLKVFEEHVNNGGEVIDITNTPEAEKYKIPVIKKEDLVQEESQIEPHLFTVNVPKVEKRIGYKTSYQQITLLGTENKFFTTANVNNNMKFVEYAANKGAKTVLLKNNGADFFSGDSDEVVKTVLLNKNGLLHA